MFVNSDKVQMWFKLFLAQLAELIGLHGQKLSVSASESDQWLTTREEVFLNRLKDCKIHRAQWYSWMVGLYVKK